MDLKISVDLVNYDAEGDVKSFWNIPEENVAVL